MPSHCPTPRELDDLELLLTGAMAPRHTFDDVVTIDLPATQQGTQEDVELVDPEGLPLALLHPDGELTALAHPAYGAFRSLHLTPAQTQERYGDALYVGVDTWLTAADIEEIKSHRRPVVLLALTGAGTPRGLSPLALVRATRAAAGLIEDAHVVAVPLASRGPDAAAAADAALRRQVLGNFSVAGDLLELSATAGDLPPEVARIRDRERARRRGVVIFFTGLSGSGKSTLARALIEKILETGERTVTSLDGDVVRRNLSAGLTFSKTDRETNIRRIGWVAAEIARHGGVAVCSPIAPFDSTRKAVRQMVAEAGGDFVLIHVATPLEECERRDRKGLYAKARAGVIPEFTGISSPYDVPSDATLALDTTGRSIEDALGDVIAVLPFALDTSEPEAPDPAALETHEALEAGD